MVSTSGLPEKTLTLRGLRTRKLLVTAARTIFERDGFATARITDIAELAGVAHGTFYTYFDSKDEIFREVILEVRQSMLTGEIDDAPASDGPVGPRESIRRANRRYLTTYRANHQLMVIWEQAATINDEFETMLGDSRQRFTERSERKILSLQRDGLADPAINAHYAAIALGAMVSKFAYIWFAGRETFDFDVAVEQLTTLWCKALGIEA